MLYHNPHSSIPSHRVYLGHLACLEVMPLGMVVVGVVGTVVVAMGLLPFVVAFAAAASPLDSQRGGLPSPGALSLFDNVADNFCGRRGCRSPPAHFSQCVGMGCGVSGLPQCHKPIHRHHPQRYHYE
jgi:hypothetical protein